MSQMRGHGEGSLFRRKTGQWVALVTMRDGRRVSRWAKTRDEAKAELAELLRLRDAGAPITGKIRLGQYLERWVSDGTLRMAPATRRKHESVVRTHLVPTLGHVRLSELSPRDVEHGIRGLDVGPQTRRHVRASLRRALADAVRDGLVPRNAAALARPEDLPHRERTILDANQARILIESTRDTRYGPLWTILVTTGLRISEALGLRWSDVDFGGTNADVGAADLDHPRGASRGLRLRDVAAPKAPSITVRHQLARENGEWVRRAPKTAKGRRTIPLTPLGVEALRAQRAMQREWRFGDGPGDARQVRRSDGVRESGLLSGGAMAGRPVSEAPAETPTPIDGLVFTTSTGHPLHGTNVVKRLADDLAAAGLPHVTCHDLRHVAATVLYSMGVPLETIADILGHSSSRITADLYRHRVPEMQQKAADKMQEALG